MSEPTFSPNGLSEWPDLRERGLELILETPLCTQVLSGIITAPTSHTCEARPSNPGY